MAHHEVEDDCGDVGRALRSWATDVLPTMDHELRTPLTTMAGWCDVLLAGELGELTEPQQAALGRIVAAGIALVEAINLVEDEVEVNLVDGVAAICHRCDSRTWPVPPAGVRRHAAPASVPVVLELSVVEHPG